MGASDSAGDMNMVDLITTSGDENDELSYEFESNSSLKAGKSGAATSGTLDRHKKLAGVTDIEAEGSIARFIKSNDIVVGGQHQWPLPEKIKSIRHGCQASQDCFRKLNNIAFIEDPDFRDCHKYVYETKRLSGP